MKTTTLTTALATCLLLAACGNDPAPAADAPQDGDAPAAEAAQTEAVYGDEAPVAIAADAASEDDHAHAADGSHMDGEEHAAEEHAAEADHPHDAGVDADHEH